MNRRHHTRRRRSFVPRRPTASRRRNGGGVLAHDVRLERANRQAGRGRTEAAAEAYLAVVAEHPNDLHLLNRTGDLLVRAGRPMQAVDLFMQVAGAWDAHGFADRAIAVYRKVLRHDPNQVEAWERLAGLYRRRGLFKEALRYAARIAL